MTERPEGRCLLKIIALFSLCWLGIHPDVWAFKTETHEVLNGRAADKSILDTYLPSQLGFQGGLGELFDGTTVRRWIQIGGSAEDQFLGSELVGAAFRSINHFHNPLLTWDQAGLNAVSVCPPFVLLGEASIRWAQKPDQGISGQAAWGDARKRFREALTFKDGSTTSSKVERDQAFARTFQILGQQLHLIGDLAVPAHTRNDPHCPLPEGFERWASENKSTVQSLIAGSPPLPDQAIFGVGLPTPDATAKAPVARLWDSDQYDGTNPAATLSSTIGLAEYTNANFFSDDTVFSPGLPFPASTSVMLGPPEPAPKTGQLRRYFKKVADGEQVDHLAVPSALYEFLPAALKDRRKGLDDRVFQDYAAKLLPRAVGYSASLLNYFFRGEVHATGDNLSAAFVNATEEEMGGTLSLYYDDEADTRRAVPQASWPVQLASSGIVTDLHFPPPSSPLPKAPEKYMLVFRGSLGGEADAVVGAEVFIASVIIVQLVKRSDGTPYQGNLVSTIDAQTQEVLGSGATDQDGRVKLRWKPGRTVLFIINQFPIYWAGENGFSSDVGQAKRLQANDVDAEGVLRVAIPLIAGDWPERIDACTGFPVLTIRTGLMNDSFFLDPERLEIVQADYGTYSSTFTRSDTGEDIALCHEELGLCEPAVDNYLVAEDLNRVGQVVGMLTWHSWAIHSRQVWAVEEGVLGRLLDTICVEFPDDTETVPVIITER